MVDAMKVNGLRTTWKAWGSTSGRTAVSTKVNIRMTRNTALDNTYGQMEDATKATGTEASNTD